MSLRLIFISIFLFGIYSRFHIYIGSILVPYIFCLIAGLGILFINKGKIRGESFYFIIIISFVSFLITFITLLVYPVAFASVLQSLVQIIYSIALGILFFDELFKYSNNNLANYFYKIIILVLVLCILDIFTPFRQFSIFVIDQFGGDNLNRFTVNREAAYFFGFPRPYPFTKEPSHVSKFLFILTVGWIILSEKKKYTKFYLLVFVSLIIIRSPIVLGAVFVILLYQVSERNAYKNIAEFSSRFIIILLLTVITFLISYLVLEARINSVVRGGDLSTYVRLIRPYLILYESIKYSPFIGVGIGNTELLAELYLMNNDLWIDTQLGKGYTINALIAPIAYWGVFGAFLHYLLFYMYVVRRTHIEYIITFLVMVFLISISMGAFNTVNYIAYVFMIIRIFSKDKELAY